MASQKYVEGRPRRLGGERSGYNQDDVMRDIIRGLMEELEWNQTRMAAAIDISQPELSRYLNDAPINKNSDKKQQMRVSDVGRLCAAVDMTPVQLFQSHELYRQGSRSRVTYPKDHLFKKFNAVLKNSEARELTALLSDAQGRGIIEECIQSVASTVEAARKGKEPKPRSSRTRRRTN